MPSSSILRITMFDFRSICDSRKDALDTVEEIIDYIDMKVPQPDIATDNNKADSVTRDFFSKFCFFIKVTRYWLSLRHASFSLVSDTQQSVSRGVPLPPWPVPLHSLHALPLRPWPLPPGLRGSAQATPPQGRGLSPPRLSHPSHLHQPLAIPPSWLQSPGVQDSVVTNT